jgi:putative DNA primase/helicase
LLTCWRSTRVSSDPFAPIAAGSKKTTAAKPPKGTVVMPVPDGAPPPLATHPILGKPTRTWCYRDAAGGVLGYACRFDTEGGKQFRPLTLWRPAGGSPLQWQWESWPPKRPLYGLWRLAERPTAPVVVTEGEKAADAAAGLMPAFVVVTSPNGSKSAAKADWSPLRGRRVIVWPDADAAGLAYATTVAKLVMKAGAESVAIVSPPTGVEVGWDAADALTEGWTTERAAELVAAAASAERITTDNSTAGDRDEKTDNGSAGGSRKRTPQRDVLIGLTEFVELWHDANRTAFATFPVNDHREHWPVRSREVRIWLSGQFYEKTGAAIGGQALEDGIRILEARAVNEGLEHECFTRTGRFGGMMYVDLGDASWRAVEITTAGSRVIEKPPLKLMRSPSMRPLPAPESGSLIEELRQFVNVKTDTDFMLVVAWIVAALRHRGPFPILVINGEAGTGKSLFSRIVRSLVDPSAAPIRAVPRDDRDLVVSASNSWVLAFDNLSSVPAWLADALCRLATGSGFATRMLHTDRDEMIFDAARPIIINGIPTLTDRADLADRAVTIHLRAIAEDERRPEDELLADFEQARPRILGALLDAVSRALENVDHVKLDRVPRMADFVKWVTAAEPGLGWEAGAFLAAYSENRRDVSEAAFEADPVAVAIWKLITTEKIDGFEGTATTLLDAINNYASEGIKKSKYWPQNPAQLGNRVARAAPLLKAKGCTVERRHSGDRIITIIPPKGL